MLFLVEEFLHFEILILVVTTLFHLHELYELEHFLSNFVVNEIKAEDKVLKVLKFAS